MTDPTLLLATGNAGKAAEFRALLPSNVVVQTLHDVALEMPAETGETFVANATAKALFAASATGVLAIADDSGLEVDALDGAPGVQSARYAGTPVSDANNREKLLAAMLSIPHTERTARFRCVVVLARDNQIIDLVHGTCDGRIATAPHGDGGFGYDSIFILPDGRTMAELSRDEKNELSHRGDAYRRILPSLRQALNHDSSRLLEE